MLYAILAYHAAGVVESWTPEEDAVVMAKLANVRERLLAEGKLGPAARLSPTEGAFTLRGQGAGMVIDGPFAETKEQLLGFYIVDCANREEAVEAARNLRQANPTAIYEIRPIPVYLPGVAFPVTEEKES